MRILSSTQMMSSNLKLSHTFRSTKPHSNPKPKSAQFPSSQTRWCVYLIASTNPPLKTYVGSTNDFPHRLKQHNGEIKGGAKASRAGRPWVCACLVHGFADQSEACKFESKWKNLSRKLPRKKKVGLEGEGGEEGMEEEQMGMQVLVRHRFKAMERLKLVFGDSKHLEIDWKISP